MSGPTYDPNQPTPPKSSSSWIWITLVVLLVLLLVCGGVCGGCFWIAGKGIREGAQAAVQSIELLGLQASAMGAISSHAEVAEKIGTITGYDAPKLVGTYGHEQPTVSCSFVVNGEKGSATATVTGTREAGALRPTDIEVKFGDGTSVNVPPGDFSPDLNFDIESQEGMSEDESTPPAEEMPEETAPAEANDSN